MDRTTSSWRLGALSSTSPGLTLDLPCLSTQKDIKSEFAKKFTSESESPSGSGAGQRRASPVSRPAAA